jgi:hypothetical protein
VALARTEAATIANRKAQAKKERLETQQEKLSTEMKKIKDEEKKLRPLERIRQIDVEPDKVVTAEPLLLPRLSCP